MIKMFISSKALKMAFKLTANKGSEAATLQGHVYYHGIYER